MNTCTHCGDEVVWHPGNGGQWIGAHPPRDWVNCHGRVDGIRHQLRIPPMTNPHLVDLWLLDRRWWLYRFNFAIAA